MLAYNLIGSSLVALGALSIATTRVRAGWGLSALDRIDWRSAGGLRTRPIRDADRQHQPESDPSVAEMGASMGPRLVIVSNRVAVPEPGNKQTAGGLVVAVKAALRNRTGVWFGWSGKIDETGDGGSAHCRAQSRNLCRHRLVEERFSGILQRSGQPSPVADPALSRRSAGIFARRPFGLSARQSPIRRQAQRLP